MRPRRAASRQVSALSQVDLLADEPARLRTVLPTHVYCDVLLYRTEDISLLQFLDRLGPALVNELVVIAQQRDLLYDGEPLDAHLALFRLLPSQEGHASAAGVRPHATAMDGGRKRGRPQAETSRSDSPPDMQVEHRYQRRRPPGTNFVASGFVHTLLSRGAYSKWAHAATRASCSSDSSTSSCASTLTPASSRCHSPRGCCWGRNTSWQTLQCN